MILPSMNNRAYNEITKTSILAKFTVFIGRRKSEQKNYLKKYK